MEGFLMIAVAIALFHFSISIVLTKELLMWEPNLSIRVFLILVVWLVPFIGALIVYKNLGLSWFKGRKKSAVNAQSNMSGALLEIDSIFNPGQKHVIEQRQKEHIELRESEAESNKE
jgi:flagellar biosynthesis/type III secretory pathway M-ring protein FliF/YscJ